MDVRSRSFQIPEGKLGAFTLDQPVLDEIGGDRADGDQAGQAAAIEAAYAGDKKVSIVDGRIYLGWNPSSPAIGDYRISYERGAARRHQRDRPAARPAVPGLSDDRRRSAC